MTIGNIIFIAVFAVFVIMFLPSIMKLCSELAEMAIEGIKDLVQYIVDDWKDFLKVVFDIGR